MSNPIETLASSPISFTQTLLSWFDVHGRKDLPWQTPRDAYRVWISEIMLQQTQVKTVIPYFNRFLTRFPDVSALANATEDDVLALWSGLGYYSRGRNLRKAALQIMHDFNGEFPRDLTNLITLPGIGPSTAAAISSLAFEQPTAILDGNVKRVLSRYFLISGAPEKATTKQALWAHATQCMPLTRCADYTQAIMDLGALICTPKKTQCAQCPVASTCLAYQNQVVEQYPEKAVKKPTPIKQQQFLLLHSNNTSIYLEKRPSKGIWGGLWCLPALEMEENASHYLLDTHQLHTQSITPLMHIKHTFSHFQLHIHALSIHVDNRTHTPPEHGRWFKAEELSTCGLATPVNAIIQRFFSSDGNVLQDGLGVCV